MKRANLNLALGLFLAATFAACGPQIVEAPLAPAARSLQPAAKGTGPILWAFGDMVRVGPTAVPSNIAHEFGLRTARHETVGFQIAVRAPMEGLTHVRVAAAAFHRAAGAKAATIETLLYREHFSNVTKASPVRGHPTSLGPGIYPDGLIPFIDDWTGKPPKPSRLRAEPIDIAGGKTQPYWIDVATSQNTPPGEYAGMVTMSSDQGSATVRVRLHVWRFTMPHAPTVDSDFELQRSQDEHVVPTQAEALRNRVQVVPVNTDAERELAENFGLKMVGLNFYSGAYYGHCKMSEPPSVEQIEQVVRRQALSYLYDQSADEIGACKNLKTKLVRIIERWAHDLHAAGVLQLITMAPIAELEDDVDLWTMLAPEYDRSKAEVKKVLAKGARAWFYTALSQDDYSPKWEVDVPPGDFPVVALIDGNLGLTGELYWALDAYSYVAGHDPWNDIESNQGGTLYAGEGILMYPGSDVGTEGLAPSMRLKWIRDGMYDADEVALLERCGLGDWAHAQTRSIAADFYRWTYDPEAIERVRERLGARLDLACHD